MIIKKCQEQNRKFLVVLIRGEKSNEDFLNFPHQIIDFGIAGKTLSALREYQIKEVVFAGGITKPSMSNIKVDTKGAVLISKILGNKLFGDDNLLSTIINFFNKEGFKVVGADEIINDLLVKKGILGEVKPDEEFYKDIKIGQNALKVISDLDIGQAAVVQQKLIIGVEAIEGTDALIKRCKDLQFPDGRKAILVKMKKQNQSTKIDMPALGVDTIENLNHSGFAGIAVQSGACLIINHKEVIRLANSYELFVVGF
jgi:hypothetical protein